MSDFEFIKCPENLSDDDFFYYLWNTVDYSRDAIWTTIGMMIDPEFYDFHYHPVEGRELLNAHQWPNNFKYKVR